MSDAQQTQLNDFLVRVFHEILGAEEDCLRAESLKDLSIREMHVIEAVCIANEQGPDNRASDIAQAQRITPGTLTTAVALLEKKGYLERRQDPKDKRIVRVYATPKGMLANQAHQAFHRSMVLDVINTLSPAEVDSLIKGLKSLQTFFEEKQA